MLRLIIFKYVTFLLIQGCIDIYAQNQKDASIFGTVYYDRSNGYLSPIRLYKKGVLISNIHTDTNGNYSFDKLLSGYYELICLDYSDETYPKYHDTTFTLNSGESARIDFFPDKYITISESMPDKLLEINADIAANDIKRGVVNILFFGQQNDVADVYHNHIDSLTRKYGFTYSGCGDIVFEAAAIGVKRYNNYVTQYLSSKNGHDWEKKFKNDYTALTSDYRSIETVNLFDFYNLLKAQTSKRGRVIINVVIDNSGSILQSEVLQTEDPDLADVVMINIHKLKFTSNRLYYKLRLTLPLKIKLSHHTSPNRRVAVRSPGFELMNNGFYKNV